MKQALETILVAFGMFSAIPVPRTVWNENNMRYALCAFPLVGVLCGLAWLGWAVLAEVTSMPPLLRGAGFCLLPVGITGGIHLDGYGDTCDALACWGDAAKKQEILKDPHCGAFAVIRLCSYFVLWFALCATLEPTKESIGAMGLGFVLSRAFSALAVTAFPLAKDTGLVHTFASLADRRRVRRCLWGIIAVAAAGLLLWGRIAGVWMLAAILAIFCRYAKISKKEFGGISGDLAGWFLQKAEIWMLAALVGCQLLEVRI